MMVRNVLTDTATKYLLLAVSVVVDILRGVILRERYAAHVRDAFRASPLGMRLSEATS